MKQQTEIRLKSPQLDELELYIEILSTGDDETGVVTLGKEDAASICEMLQWIQNSLSNRRDYHKLRSIKSKVVQQRLEEALRAAGRDVAQIKKQALSEVADTIIDESSGDDFTPNQL